MPFLIYMYLRSLMIYWQSTKMLRFYRRYDDSYVCVVFDVERNCFQEFKEEVWCPQPRQMSPRAPDVYIPILRKFLSWSIFVCSRQCSYLGEFSILFSLLFFSRVDKHSCQNNILVNGQYLTSGYLSVQGIPKPTGKPVSLVDSVARCVDAMFHFLISSKTIVFERKRLSRNWEM